MKRSEMLRIIYQASCMEVPSSDDAETQLAYRVENILTAIEAAGMLPPGFRCINQSNKAPTSFGSYMLHEWEEE